ncbi:PQQ-binding-like beta-propeller repeat protein [Promicromonospora sp. NPDC060204]|uniref:outer membrane protein assembly factor BamB family protein n=1 Tax=Promicromonospora sp. NPDC060204 TaxID=3347071 RepID=UPI00365256B6
MAREPGDGGRLVFDLVDDGAGSAAPVPRSGSGDLPLPDDDEGGAGAGEGGAGSDAGGTSNGRLRVLVPVAAVLAVVLGTGLAVEGARDGARMERMRDVSGGVGDVSGPLAETWRWEGLVGSRAAIDEGRGNEVAVLGDVLVFESDGELVALRPATGEEAWTVPLGENPDCGPFGAAGWARTTTPSLVCLDGSGADRAVTTVGPDGVVSARRELPAADTDRFGLPRPGPDGTVLRARRAGPGSAVDLGDARCTDTGECSGTVVDGQDLALRAEDAVTGVERWSTVVPFRATRADQCNNWLGSTWDGAGSAVDLAQMIDPRVFGARIGADLVQLYGCGIETAVTPGGVPLGTDIEPGTGGVTSLVSGGYTGFTFEGMVRTVLYDGAGAVVGEIEGHALEPGVTDGEGPGVLLAMDPAGPRLRAYETDGTPRWDATTGFGGQLFLAQVAGTMLVMTGAGDVRGLDAATGETRWVWDGADGADGRYPEDLYVSRTFTDGESVLLLTENGSGGGGLVALDAASGEVVWEQHGDAAVTGGMYQGFDTSLVAVDGHLLEVTPSGVRGLG